METLWLVFVHISSKTKNLRVALHSLACQPSLLPSLPQLFSQPFSCHMHNIYIKLPSTKLPKLERKKVVVYFHFVNQAFNPPFLWCLSFWFVLWRCFFWLKLGVGTGTSIIVHSYVCILVQAWSENGGFRVSVWKSELWLIRERKYSIVGRRTREEIMAKPASCFLAFFSLI